MEPNINPTQTQQPTTISPETTSPMADPISIPQQPSPEPTPQTFQTTIQPIKPLSASKATTLNAFSICFATFFGLMLTIASISLFTKGKWIFSFPFLNSLLSANSYNASTTYLSIAFSAVFFGVISILTMKKATTDQETVQKTWKTVSNIFLIFGIIYAMNMLATAIYALLGVGEESGLAHEALWLDSFLPSFIISGVNLGIFAIANMISKGKAYLIKIMSIVATSIASVALTLIFINILVSFYGKSGSSYYNLDDIYKMYNEYY